MQTPKQGQKKDTTTFGGRVEIARERMEWSQEDLAQRINSSSKTISRYEQRTDPPRDERIVQDIAEATGAPLAWLLSGQEGSSQDSDQNAFPDEIDITGGIFAGGKVQEEEGTPRSVQSGRAGKRSAKGATVRTRIAAEGGEIVEFGGAKGEGIKISADTISVQGIRVHLSQRRSGFDITISFRAVPEASPSPSGGSGDRADITISGERLKEGAKGGGGVDDDGNALHVQEGQR